MRLLIWGHWSHTGFGRVTMELGERFVRAGVDVRVIAVNHRGEPIKGDLAGRVWPADIMGHDFGANINGPAITGEFWRGLDVNDDWKPDVGLMIGDAGSVANYIGRKIDPAWDTIPVLNYCPIEGDNLNPSWRDLWSILRPVAMSQYGQRQMSTLLGRDVPMVYHGVNTDSFRPVSATDPFVFEDQVLATKEDCKRAFGFDPNRKIVLRADRAVQRKFYDVTLRAMTMVFPRDPDVDLVLHCRPYEEDYILLEDIARLPPEFRQEGKSRVKLTNAHNTWTGLPEAMLVALYNAADIYLTTTSGEGFGLTIAESLACGVPVVSTGWAAEVEVVGPGGIIVPPLHDQYGDTVRVHSKFGMDWGYPDARGFVEPVLRLLSKPALRRDMGRAGRRHVMSSFNWEAATAQFIALFEGALSTEVAA